MSQRTSARRTEGGQDSLELVLRDRPIDEKNGVNASLGFTFQQWWAALSIAELLASGDDFAVGAEVKEDIAILDSAQSPTRVEFCQVKKHERDGVWVLKDLHKKGTKRKDGTHEHSILAKLYTRRTEFGAARASLRFVSNIGVKLPDEADRASLATNTDLSALTAEQQQLVKQAISAQLGIPEEDIDLAGVLVHKTNLPLGEPEIFVGGKLEQLSSTGQLPFQLSHTSVAARVLASEVQSRASSTTYPVLPTMRVGWSSFWSRLTHLCQRQAPHYFTRSPRPVPLPLLSCLLCGNAPLWCLHGRQNVVNKRRRSLD